MAVLLSAAFRGARGGLRGVSARLSSPGAPVLSWAPRGLSTAAAVLDQTDDDWDAAFVEATEHFSGDSGHDESSAALRSLVKSGLLKHTDLRDRPERFFKAHRLLARHAVKEGPGFWIRFTVHYNLCFGTVLAVGGPEQIAAMEDVERLGQLGCFALTEKLAGVQSGLVVETTATYRRGAAHRGCHLNVRVLDASRPSRNLSVAPPPTTAPSDDRSSESEPESSGARLVKFAAPRYDDERKEWVIDSPTAGSEKNWISQGHVADKAVVLAATTVGGRAVGPHAFLMDLKSEGVSTGDMGVKTTGNDLDNAWISFAKVRVPRSALLNAHCDVDEATGDYVLKTDGVAPFEMIGQRLYTGRVAVAQAALAFRAQLFDVTKAYADAKRLPDVSRAGKDPRLSGVPQLKALFAEADATAGVLEAFLERCEDRLAPLLKTGAVPDHALAHAIAVAKVKAVEHSIDLCWRLKQEVGSYALMGDSGFKHLDFLNCCKFAEGDSRILMQKMARDRLKRFAADAAAGAPANDDDDDDETRLAGDLAAALAPAQGDRAKQAELWDDNYELVYALAEQMMDRTIAEFMRGD